MGNGFSCDLLPVVRNSSLLTSLGSVDGIGYPSFFVGDVNGDGSTNDMVSQVSLPHTNTSNAGYRGSQRFF